jgi:glucose 1-dehydrogenase
LKNFESGTARNADSTSIQFMYQISFSATDNLWPQVGYFETIFKYIFLTLEGTRYPTNQRPTLIAGSTCISAGMVLNHHSKANMRFANKVCLVTGGGSGIGRATCIRLGAEGGTIVVIDMEETGGKETVRIIQAAGGAAVFAKVDIGLPEQVEACIQQVVTEYNRIDVVVNNAAMMTFTPIIGLSLEDWDRLMNVNLRAVFLFSKYCLPHIQNGAFVNISSVHAHQTTPNVIPYASSKGAIEAFTRGMSREYEPAKARFNAVAPGAVDTPMLWSNPNVISGKEVIEGAIGKPEDLAAAICFLASDEAAYINGTTLVVDGGRLAIL